MAKKKPFATLQKPGSKKPSKPKKPSPASSGISDSKLKGRTFISPEESLRYADTPRKRANVFRQVEANRSAAEKAGAKFRYAPGLKKAEATKVGQEYEAAHASYKAEKKEKKAKAKESWREKKSKEKKNKAGKKSKAATKASKSRSKKSKGGSVKATRPKVTSTKSVKKPKKNAGKKNSRRSKKK